MEEKKTTNQVALLTVSFDNDKNTYVVSIPAGSSVTESVFCVSVVAKCLERDGKCTLENFKELLNKYLTDPQYDEVKQ